MSDTGSKPTGNPRAAALRNEIDKLTSGNKPEAGGGKKPDKPTNPRDYIQHWMAEHDKKPEK